MFYKPRWDQPQIFLERIGLDQSFLYCSDVLWEGVRLFGHSFWRSRGDSPKFLRVDAFGQTNCWRGQDSPKVGRAKIGYTFKGTSRDWPKVLWKWPGLSRTFLGGAIIDQKICLSSKSWPNVLREWPGLAKLFVGPTTILGVARIAQKGL